MRWLVHNILDIVEDALRKRYPVIEKLAMASEGNTIFEGELYYTLEDYLVELLEDAFKEKLMRGL